jgi:hypothetical protein
VTTVVMIQAHTDAVGNLFFPGVHALLGGSRYELKWVGSISHSGGRDFDRPARADPEVCGHPAGVRVSSKSTGVMRPGLSTRSSASKG